MQIVIGVFFLFFTCNVESLGCCNVLLHFVVVNECVMFALQQLHI